MKQITKEECPECNGALRGMYARDHFMCMDCKIEYELIDAKAPPKTFFSTTIPVVYQEEVVGKLQLAPEVVDALEDQMKVKLQNLNSEPFILSLNFELTTASSKFTLKEMNINET